MVDVNFGLGQNNALQYFQFGQQMGQQARLQQDERAKKSALAGYAMNPDDPKARNALASAAPEMALKYRGDEQKRDADAKQAAREQMVTIGRLLDGANDPVSYQQSLAAAQQAGLDVSKAPQTFNPEWVNQQRLIVRAYSKDDGQTISGIARELVDAGYKPGTPEFNQAMVGVINNKYASEYVDDQGNTRRRSALNLGAAPTPQPTPLAAPTAGSNMPTGNPLRSGDPIPVVDVITEGGKTYYKFADGKVYDNPERR